MSIRAKILLILALGMLVAICVSALAYFNAYNLDRAIDRILTHDMAALRAVSEGREALRDARRTENLMVAWRDPSLKSDIDRSLAELTQSIEAGRTVAPDIETSDTYTDILQQSESYKTAVSNLVTTLREGQDDLDERVTDMGTEIARFSTALDRLQTEITAAPAAAGPGPPPQGVIREALTDEERTRAKEAINQTRAALQRVSEIDPKVVDFETARVDQLREQVERRLSALEERVAQLAHVLSGTAYYPAASNLANVQEGVARAATHVSEAAAGMVGGVNALRGETQGLRNQIESDFATLNKTSWYQLEQRRADIGQQRSIAITIILSILVGGLALILLLGAVLMRGMTRNFNQLLDAARAIQRGELDTRVRMKSRDELHELAQAFNAMARYLDERRRQQIDYNEIVSLLNSSLDIDEILTGSLEEIIERSGSSIGAFYIADEEEEVLELAKGFGLSAALTERTTYKLGAGLVGQAAKTRRKILVSPVPEGAFGIDIGVGTLQPEAVLILPVVHVDTLLGVFVLVSSGSYKEDTLQFIEEVVFQFGVALNNARFVETIENTAKALRERTDELIRQRGRLETVNRELEDANRTKSEFLANVTHELRTPLNSIIGFTELVLAKSNELAHKPRRHLETVLRNGRSLLGLINDLLDVTKIESGQVTMRMTTVDVAELIEDCLQTISPLVERDHVSLESRIEQGITEIHTDPQKLKQVLLNLLSNATKFTDEGAIRVDLRSLDDDWVEIAVIDTGIGIHSDDLPHIFDKFRQVDGSVSRKYGGTGLGLTITSELVRLMGGEITARSEPGAGSTFLVKLPAGPAATLRQIEAAASRRRVEVETVPADTPELPVESPNEPEEQPFPRPKSSDGIPRLELPDSRTEDGEGPGPAREVVVLDKEPDSVIRLREGLRNDGFDVKSAFVCADAVALLEHRRVAALILGTPLPENDAEAAYEQLSELLDREGVPVIQLGNPDGLNKLSILPIGRLDRPPESAQALAILMESGVEAPSRSSGMLPAVDLA